MKVLLFSFRVVWTRREQQFLYFTLKYIKHPINERIFPTNPNYNNIIRKSEPFLVNFASTDDYTNSSIPLYQRLLNHCFKKKAIY